MKKFATALFILTLNFTAAHADQKDIDALRAFTSALQTNDYPAAKQYISTRSNDLFDRYSKYDLGNMTPSYGRVVSQSANKNFRYLKVQNDVSANAKLTNVAFVTENGAAKIDLPESLRLGFGPNWQQRVNTIEQAYVFSRQNLGEQQSQQILQNLLAKQQ